MITVTFGKMSKRSNSTKQTMTNTKNVEVVLKENVDINTPIFKVNFNPVNYNYCSWQLPESNLVRYYYIDNIVYIHNKQFEVHCSLDLLATYKADIKNSSGRVLYSSNELLWDQYCDDMRFSPTGLDTYSFFSFDDNNSYLHKDVFLLDDNPNFIDTADGTYILTCISNGTLAGKGAGPHTYLLNTSELQSFMTNLYSFWTGGPFEGSSARVDAIRALDWVPFNKGILVSRITNSYTADIEISGDIILSNATCVPCPCVIHYTGTLDIPKEKSSVPYWMQNARWNDCQLLTPGGYTNINLDMCYPRTNHTGLSFATTIDVISGDIDVKFLYDTKGGWDDMEGTIAYATCFNYGQDVMYLIQRMRDVKKDIYTALGLGVTAAAGAFAGGMSAGMTGAAGGMAKISAAAQHSSIANNMAGTSGQLSAMDRINMMSGIEDIKNSSAPNLGKLAMTGVAISKLSPSTNRSLSSANYSGSVAAMFNTSELGKARLRLKPFRCKDLASDSSTSSEYASPYDKYKHYCETYGYPVNQFLDLSATGLYGFNNQYLATEGLTVKPISEGITDEISMALSSMCNSGIWLE